MSMMESADNVDSDDESNAINTFTGDMYEYIQTLIRKKQEDKSISTNQEKLFEKLTAKRYKMQKMQEHVETLRNKQLAAVHTYAIKNAASHLFIHCFVILWYMHLV